MSKFRKIESKIWNDQKFNTLSDKGKLLFFFLLTHPHLTGVGAMRTSVKGLGCELGWDEKAFHRAFREVSGTGMVKVDERACFLWLPNFLKYNKPESPNVVKSWQGMLDYLPECSLKTQLIQQLKDLAEGLSQGFREAFPKTLLNQEQEQEQEQEEEICPVARATRPVSSDQKSKLGNQDNNVEAVFSHWQTVLNHPKAKLDDKRKRVIQAALTTLDFSVANLKQAIEGCAKSDFHMGQSEKSQRYDGVDLIFRNAEHIEKFMDMNTSPAVEPRRMALSY